MLIVVGLIIVVLIGGVSWLFGCFFLILVFGYFEVLLVGEFELVLVMVFDFGVYFVVVGVMLLILINFGLVYYVSYKEEKI